MKYQGWMLLFAGLIAGPQWAVGAEAWGTPAAYPQAVVSHGVGAPASSRFSSYTPPVDRAAIPRYAEMAAPMRAQGFRFRPWDGVNSSHMPQPAVFPRRAAPSYWGGTPVSGGPGIVPSVAAENVQQPWNRFAPGWRPSEPPAGNISRRMANTPWSAQGYRFRPLPPARQNRLDRPVRYRPLQVQIPDRYVFRPLNPVARTAPAPASQRPAWSYPPVAYSMGRNGYSPYVAVPPGSWYPNVYSVPAYAASPWGGMPPAYGQPMRRMPNQYFRPPVYAQDMKTAPRFRPVQPQRRDYTNRRGYGQRYARQHPAWRRPAIAPAPYWADQRRSPFYAYSPYGLDQRTAQRPPIPSARLNRYGTDWYDGRGDGEGAWYRLAVEAAPAVSQSWESDSSLSGDRY